MVNSCCAYGCKKRYSATDNIKFHRFPKNNVISKQWIDAINRKDFKPTRYSFVCGKHFQDSDYYINVHGNKNLNKGAVPSIFEYNNTNDSLIKLQTRKTETSSANSFIIFDHEKSLCSSSTTYNNLEETVAIKSEFNIKQFKGNALEKNPEVNGAVPSFIEYNTNDSLIKSQTRKTETSSANSFIIFDHEKPLCSSATTYNNLEETVTIKSEFNINQFKGNALEKNPEVNGAVPSFVEYNTNDSLIKSQTQKTETNSANCFIIVDHEKPLCASSTAYNNLGEIVAIKTEFNNNQFGEKALEKHLEAKDLNVNLSFIGTQNQKTDSIDSHKRKEYFGDFVLKDLDSPNKRRKFWHVSQSTVKEQRKRLKYYTNRNRRLQKRIETLQNSLDYLVQQNKISHDV